VALSHAICLVVANLALLLLIRLFAIDTAVEVEWWLQVLMAVGALLAGSFGFIYQQLYWHRPVRLAVELLREVRAGQAAIGELDAIGGGIAPLITQIQYTLRDLRRQRGDIARLEREMNQRVVNRTDALERNIAALKQQATKDALTGLYNRRMFELHLPMLVERCRARGMPLSLLMIDVDDFKVLNDTLGHAAGDAFLKSFGQLVRSSLRSTDLAYRYGGDEFVIAIPCGSREQAEPLCRRLMSLVDALSKTLRVPIPPRLSIGVFCSTDMPPSAMPESMLLEADRLLYETKQARKAARAAAAA
jgi:diguanylate cyclase (GGDEF)-like protein